MGVKEISANDLRTMENSEGLILQGCGGSLDEWVDGINDLLTEEGILLDGTRFSDVSSFRHDGLTCLLFSFTDDVKLDAGKLAMWRIASHADFGGTWLSDYVPNRLGGFIPTEQAQGAPIKPDCPLIGEDGNIFNLMGIAARTLRRNGLPDQANEMCDRITSSSSYSAALGVIGEYVNITSAHEPITEEDHDPRAREPTALYEKGVFSPTMEINNDKEDHDMNEWERQHRQAEMNKRLYPPGTRVLLIQMGNDPDPVSSNTRGTVECVDDIGTVFCAFDNGRSLGLISGEDSFRKLTERELAEEQVMEDGPTGPVMDMEM